MSTPGSPKLVHAGYLQNDRLLTPEQIEKVKLFFQTDTSASYFPGDTDISFPVVKTSDNQLIALYIKLEDLFIPAGELDPLKTKVAAEKERDLTGIYPLGVGRDGVVVAAQSLTDGSWMAAKFETLPKSQSLQTRMESIEMEQAALKTQSGVFKGAASINHALHLTMMTAMKLGPGKDLNEAMIDEHGVNKLTLAQKLDIAVKVITATAELPKNNLVHRDFKPNNVMADPTTGEIMLIDFGGAGQLDDQGNFYETEPIGTQGYQAPELLTGGFFVERRIQSENTMAFSLGISLAEIFTKNSLRVPSEDWRSHYSSSSLLPLPDESNFRGILGCFHDVLGNNPDDMSKQNIVEREMNRIVHQLIHLDPNQRISIDLAAKELKVIQDYHNLLTKHGVNISDHNDANSLLEHMNKVKTANPQKRELVTDIEKLQLQITKNNRQVVEYNVSLLVKRLDLYTSHLEPKNTLTRKHKKMIQQYCRELKEIDLNVLDSQEKYSTLKNKIYSEKSMYEITLAHRELEQSLRLLESKVGPNACANANKEAREINALLSKTPISQSDISELYSKVISLKASLLTIRRKADPTIQEETKSMLRSLTALETNLQNYQNFHEISRQSLSDVSEPEKKRGLTRKITKRMGDLFSDMKSASQRSTAAPHQIIPDPQVTTASHANLEAIQREKIQFLLEYPDLMKGILSISPSQAVLNDRRANLEKYAKDSDPMVQTLALAIKAKQAGDDQPGFERHMTEFKQQLQSGNEEIRAFSQRIASKITRLESPSQMTPSTIPVNTSPSLHALARENSIVSKEQIANCLRELKTSLSDNIKRSKLNTAEKIIAYISSSLSGRDVTLQMVETLHNQTKHIWNAPDNSPLAKLMKEKMEEQVTLSEDKTARLKPN